MLKELTQKTQFKKAVAMLLVFTLTFANWLTLGKVIAASIPEEENVEFDAYFEVEGSKVHEVLPMLDDEIVLNLEVEVNGGYLKDAKVYLNGLGKSYEVHELESAEIDLKQVNSGELLKQTIPLTFSMSDIVNVANLNSISTVKISGTHVSEDGEEKFTKEIDVRINWQDKSQISITQEYTKYANFETGVILQSLIKVQRNDEQTNLPIEETEVTVNIPKIENQKFVKAFVSSINTSATNGKILDDVVVSQDDGDSEKLSFKVSNEEVKGKVWAGKGQDEYLVTYVYEAESENEITTLNIQSDVAVEMKLYNKAEVVTATLTDEKEVTKTEDILSYELKTNVNEISKGKLYANHIKEADKYEIRYETQVIVNIPYAKVVEFEMAPDELLNKDDESMNKANVSYYKLTKISKANFDEILGEEGYIRILNGQKEVARIDSGNIADENGYYTITYTENFASLKMETSKPISEGNLIIVNEKQINNEITFTDEEIVGLAKIQTSLNENTAEIGFAETNSGIDVEIDKTELSSIAVNKDVTMKIILNNKDENTLFYQDPVFDVILPENVENIDIKQSDILYAEGLEIKQVQKGKVGNKPAIRVSLEGTQEEFSSGVLSDGTNIVIKADISLKELSPNVEDELQVKYQNYNPIATLLGANLGEATADVTLTAPEEVISIQTIKNDDVGKEVTSIDDGKVAGKLEIFDEAKTKQMELKVLNNYTVPIGNIFVLGRIPYAGNKSPEGIDLGSTFSTTLKGALTSSLPEAMIYYSEYEDATILLDEKWKKLDESDLSKVKSYLVIIPQDITLDPAESLTFTYDFEVPANLEHNSETYGALTTSYRKILSEDNKVAEKSVAEFVGLSTGEGPQLKLELSTNVEDGAVVREGQRVVYTAKVTNTGKNVAENVMVTVPVPENMCFVNYIDGEYISDVDVKEQTYTIEALEPGESKEFSINVKVNSLPTMETYYDAQKDEIGYYIENKKHILVNETTQDKINDVEGQVLQIDEEIYLYSDYKVNGEYYLTTVFNNGLVTYSDGKYYMEVTEKEYIEEYIPIKNKAKLTANKLQKELTSEETLLKGVKMDILFQTTIDKSSFTDTVREGVNVRYNIYVKNNSERDLSNLDLKMDFSEALKYEAAYIVTAGEETTYEANLEEIEAYIDNKIQYKITKLEAGKGIQIRIDTTTKSLGEDYEKNVSMVPSITVENMIYTSDPMEIKVARARLTAKQTTSEENSYIKEGDKFTYTLEIKNDGVIQTRDLTVKANLPEELSVEEMYYEIAGVKIDMAKINKNELVKILQPGETLKIVATVKANKLAEGLTEKKITNSFDITETGRTIEVNSISHTIEVNPNYTPDTPSAPVIPDKPTKPDEEEKPIEKTYKISGTAWLDENKNGQMESSEKKLGEIEVYVINQKGETVQTTKTDASGNYTFENLSKGTYIVAFKYDNKTYNLTDYQKDGISDSVNSDVIGTEGTAITDDIKITDTSVGNVNMGLVIKETFDLKLDKYVSKIVVQTTSGTKEYVQKEETTLAKVEIKAKELKGAKVMMEYNIVVTNEGKTAGYAKEIIDYMPRDTEFSSELNSGWYLGSDGYLHTTQLKDILIQPGESKTIKVVLSRNMTENNTDTVNNRAEVAISHNQDLTTDEDSIAGNKLNNEDDIGYADIIIGVATGSEVIYITLAIVSMIILGTGMYFIKRKVLDK